MVLDYYQLDLIENCIFVFVVEGLVERDSDFEIFNQKCQQH